MDENLVPDTPVVKPGTPRSAADPNEVLFGDDEIDTGEEE